MESDSNSAYEAETESGSEVDMSADANYTIQTWEQMADTDIHTCPDSKKRKDAQGNCVAACDTMGRCYSGTIPAQAVPLMMTEDYVFFREPAMMDALNDSIVVPSSRQIWGRF